MRYLLIICTLAAALCSQARPHVLTQAETDSTSIAMASLWIDHFKTQAATLNPKQYRSYKQGVTMALDSARVNDNFISNIEQGAYNGIKKKLLNDAFKRGLNDGVAAYRRLQQAELIGEFELNMVRLRLAFDKALNGHLNGYTPQQAEEFLIRLNTRLLSEDRMVIRGVQYLDSLRQCDSIIALPSGVVLKVIAEGEGDSPDDNDLIMVNYSGRLLDGTVFNATEPGQPTIFEMETLIPGFREGVTHMKKGGACTIYIPSELGFGKAGVLNKVPSDALVIFDVELVDLRHIDDPLPATPPAE